MCLCVLGVVSITNTFDLSWRPPPLPSSRPLPLPSRPRALVFRPVSHARVVHKPTVSFLGWPVFFNRCPATSCRSPRRAARP
jgi:hypothetical protein